MKNPETQLIHKSAAVRQQAAMELAVTPRFYSDLLKLFEDPHPEVRLAAIAAIHSMTKATIPTASLVKLLNDEDRFVCSFAARAMARDQVYGKAYVDRLEKCLDDRNADYDFRPHRGAEAAEAILKLDPNGQAAKKALQFFLSEKMLKDQRIDSEGTRTAAARALARCGTAAAGALPELRKRLTDPVPATRIAAAEALLSISTKKEDEVDARRLIEKALRSPSIPEVIQAMRVVRDSKLPLDLLEPLKKSSEGVIQAELKSIAAR
jgi:HEAT repeat protein